MISALLFLAWQAKSIEKNIVYSHVDGVDVAMDIYHPDTPAAVPTPAVVVIHGGAWVSGKRQDVDQFAQEIAKLGYAVANIDYRLAPKFKWPAMLDDCQTAVRFLRANAAKYHIDPKRIGSAGFSAGGHLALFLGVSDTRNSKTTEFAGESSRTKVILDFFGPTDMTQDYPPMFDSLYQTILGKKRADAAEEIKSASPYYLVDKSSAPVFIFQGLQDPLVNPHQSRILEEKYKALGVPVTSFFVENVGHELPLDKPGVGDAVKGATDWLKKYL